MRILVSWESVVASSVAREIPRPRVYSHSLARERPWPLTEQRRTYWEDLGAWAWSLIALKSCWKHQEKPYRGTLKLVIVPDWGARKNKAGSIGVPKAFTISEEVAWLGRARQPAPVTLEQVTNEAAVRRPISFLPNSDQITRARTSRAPAPLRATTWLAISTSSITASRVEVDVWSW